VSTRLPQRLLRAAGARAASRRWAPFSRLLVVGDGAGWSLDEDARHLRAIAGRIGAPLGPAAWAPHVGRQVVFLTSHFAATQPRWLDSTHRLATAWFHGRPGTPGYPEFDQVLAAVRRNPDRIARFQVTHAEMHDLLLEAGVEPDRVHRIPIGIDLTAFPAGDRTARDAARAAFGLPAEAFVVGSFQKDGSGWGEGLEPKHVKGPDTLVGALECLRRNAPELVVLLTGPARGYVKRELGRLGIPFRHVLLDDMGELARAYHALDAYLVASRQEGGPKAVLESLATGTPLVTTRVGQATEIVRDGVDGVLVDADDVERLAAGLARVREDREFVAELRRHGRQTAESFDHALLDERWQQFFNGIVE
jgi:glycosyltransferase involved in cell wall biosynthesis